MQRAGSSSIHPTSAPPLHPNPSVRYPPTTMPQNATTCYNRILRKRTHATRQTLPKPAIPPPPHAPAPIKPNFRTRTMNIPSPSLNIRPLRR